MSYHTTRDTRHRATNRRKRSDSDERISTCHEMSLSYQIVSFTPIWEHVSGPLMRVRTTDDIETRRVMTDANVAISE